MALFNDTWNLNIYSRTQMMLRTFIWAELSYMITIVKEPFPTSLYISIFSIP